MFDWYEEMLCLIWQPCAERDARCTNRVTWSLRPDGSVGDQTDEHNHRQQHDYHETSLL
jgi:hypothetical protein